MNWRFAGSDWGEEGGVFVDWNGAGTRGGGMGGVCGWMRGGGVAFDGWVRSRVGFR